VTPPAFLAVLIFWLTAMFAGFGLFAPRNAMTITVLCLGAFSLAAAIFLIEEMSDPFDGVIALSSAPMVKAVGLLGK
jgi:phosphatidylglycerophosphate synthase